MATILFWNINKKNLLQDIVYLCHHHNVDILILAESQISDANLLPSLNSSDSNGLYFGLFNNLASRLSFFFRYPHQSVRPVADSGGVSIRHISPPIGVSLLLVGLHLPSKLHLDEREQMMHATRISKTIQEAERNVGHSRTLVIGDFNMNPFEPGLVASDGFHAVMDQKIARRRSRSVQGEDKPFFYNPMWGLMGDSSPGSSGTYYDSKGGYINYFWNTFDQVLLRPDLLNHFSQESLQVISEVGSKSLLAETGLLKSVSDHLPVLVRLSIERTMNYE
ncbi:MAG: endonuclease/exonuclease/phosphatase family protein [Timaviella obliquedivisa GSE-PSE-MK23-08B]|jgi:hypothetical protein|nr:endonuclease/exonuclease/phosphatase family protein [Timaviella obliquedivisa GSE-PSE-MK23-08B]